MKNEEDSMNNDYIGDDEEDDTNLKLNNISHEWGTWEELLLACAVKRHGFSDWDSVATEVQSRTSLSAVFVSANNCRLKYRYLKRRFHESAAAAAVGEEGGEEERISNIPWLEHLRSLRVAELRREVQRYDVSILSLQLKVKKLEEEREGNVVGDQKLDLEDERKGARSGNDGSESEHREKAVFTAEESVRENRWMNESNSATSGGKNAGEDDRVGGDEPSQTRDDSGDNNLVPDPKAEEGSEASHSGELDESGTSGRNWKSKRRKHSGGSKNYHDGDGETRSQASKSQPLIGLLDLIRSHPRGSLFERRLRSQEARDYKSTVKQHLDIETIQRKLKQGSYDSSSVTFYRDLQLLFTNAIVFFPSSSSESMAAHELRTVVSEEMRKETGKSSPRLMINRESSAMNSIKAGSETSDSQKSSAPLVACKKRSFVSTTKASPSSSSFSQKEETKEETVSVEKENIVTGVRSSRRSNKVIAASAAAVVTNNSKTGKGKNKQKQTESNDNKNNKQENSKTEKKTVSSDKKKSKKSVTDFLKRLKKNSPQKEGKDQNSKKESKTKPRELRSKSVGKKKAEVENNTPVKRAPGRPQKKMAEAGATATVSASGKRGRESGSTGKDNKQAKKRRRR